MRRRRSRRTPRQVRRRRIRLGVTAAVLILIGTILTFTKQFPFLGSGYQLQAVFASANQLKPGDEVRLAGLPAGKVTAIGLRRPRHGGGDDGHHIGGSAGPRRRHPCDRAPIVLGGQPSMSRSARAARAHRCSAAGRRSRQSRPASRSSTTSSSTSSMPPCARRSRARSASSRPASDAGAVTVGTERHRRGRAARRGARVRRRAPQRDPGRRGRPGHRARRSGQAW